MDKQHFLSIIFILSFGLFSCNSDSSIATPESDYISAVDISQFPEIKEYNHQFYNLEGGKKEFLSILKEAGINTVRLRIWNNPSSGYNSLAEVSKFSKELKSKGFKIWITPHFSDTWADPAHQLIPKSWENYDFQALLNSVKIFTQEVVEEIKPDYIQIGNEINNGLIHPFGERYKNSAQFLKILETISKAIRTESPHSKIMVHYAGSIDVLNFLKEIEKIDYDMVGLSYYPKWHGKDLNLLFNSLNQIKTNFDKQVCIAEFAYPFTHKWEDWTNNIIGSDEQIIANQFPATKEGQKNFVKELKKRIVAHQLSGFCYWGAELIAWKSDSSKTGSSWENQALFDFENKATPALYEMNFNK